MAHILIIDDEEVICRLLTRKITMMGHEVSCSNTLKDGLDKTFSENYDVVLLDIRLPDGNGLESLPFIKNSSLLAPEVIVITGMYGNEGEEQAYDGRAWDYVKKDSSLLNKLTGSLLSALRSREEKQSRNCPVDLKRNNVIGSSYKIKSCLADLAQAAGSDESVLIIGETGTGKELFARAIHDNSAHRQNNFQVIDCAALSESLLESELFGHEKGAYTGAESRKAGLLKLADQGTVFLDEIGELPFSKQKKFLRALQEHSFRPVGSNYEVKSDFRLVSATNKDLEQMTGEGKFREDLLYRLNSYCIRLPPLRERKEDIREIAVYHIDQLCRKHKVGPKKLTPEFIAALDSYDWPGNVRELINTLNTVFWAAKSDRTVYHNYLSTKIRLRASQDANRERCRFPKLREVAESAIAREEKKYLQELMNFTGGCVDEACQLAGVGRSRIYDLLKKYRITPRESRKH